MLQLHQQCQFYHQSQTLKVQGRVLNVSILELVELQLICKGLLPNPIYHLSVFLIPMYHEELMSHQFTHQRQPSFHLHFHSYKVRLNDKLLQQELLNRSLVQPMKMELFQHLGTKHHLQVHFLCYLQTPTNEVQQILQCVRIFNQELIQLQVRSSMLLNLLRFSYQEETSHLKREILLQSLHHIQPFAFVQHQLMNEQLKEKVELPLLLKVLPNFLLRC